MYIWKKNNENENENDKNSESHTIIIIIVWLFFIGFVYIIFMPVCMHERLGKPYKVETPPQLLLLLFFVVEIVTFEIKG